MQRYHEEQSARSKGARLSPLDNRSSGPLKMFPQQFARAYAIAENSKKQFASPQKKFAVPEVEQR